MAQNSIRATFKSLFYKRKTDDDAGTLDHNDRAVKKLGSCFFVCRALWWGWEWPALRTGFSSKDGNWHHPPFAFALLLWRLTKLVNEINVFVVVLHIYANMWWSAKWLHAQYIWYPVKDYINQPLSFFPLSCFVIIILYSREEYWIRKPVLLLLHTFSYFYFYFYFYSLLFALLCSDALSSPTPTREAISEETSILV